MDSVRLLLLNLLPLIPSMFLVLESQVSEEGTHIQAEMQDWLLPLTEHEGTDANIPLHVAALLLGHLSAS